MGMQRTHKILQHIWVVAVWGCDFLGVMPAAARVFLFVKMAIFYYLIQCLYFFWREVNNKCFVESVPPVIFAVSIGIWVDG